MNRVWVLLGVLVALSFVWGCGGAGDGGGPTISFDSTQLIGPPSESANSHIPDVPLTDPPAADITAPDGIPISVRDLLIVFTDTATVADVNALIQSLPAEIAGGIPEGKLLLLRLTGASDLTRVFSAQDTLLSNSLVVAVSINFGMENEQLPSHNVNTKKDRWTWEEPLKRSSGNWGLKAIRMPQAWNLYDYSVRQNSTIAAAVLEAGDPDNAIDATHEDLQPRVDILATSKVDDHATMVGGIISATWDNRRGIEGVYPRNLTLVSRGATFAGTLTDSVIRVLKMPDVRVINSSVGLSNNYARNGIDPVTAVMDPGGPTFSQVTDNAGNVFLETIQNFETSTKRSKWLMFCTAGNLRKRPRTSEDFKAVDNSPCANVASRSSIDDPTIPLPNGGAGADHFLSVEAVDQLYERASFSAAGGTVSAPGECIRSAEAHDAINFDEVGLCSTGDTDDADYATNSGTSFSTPHVTGLAAYLWSLNPGLTYQQVRLALKAFETDVKVGAGPQGGLEGARRIDAFAAALGIDVILKNKTLQTALVDVDDGTLDGNRRTIRNDDGTLQQNDDAIHTADGRRGDGKISMSDLRALRDAMIQAGLEDWDGDGKPDLNPADTDLDGAANHKKKDLNQDGCVGRLTYPSGASNCDNAPGENVYPRFDFNGDGRVTPFSLTTSGSLDIGYFLNGWPTDPELNEGWTAEDLEGPYSNITHRSGDVEFRTNIQLAAAFELDEIRITINQAGRPVSRSITGIRNRLVWTLPIINPTSLKVEGFNNSRPVNKDLCLRQGGGTITEIPALKNGQDIVVLVVDCAAGGGPSLIWRTSTIAQATTFYRNLDSQGRRVDSGTNIASPFELDFANDEPQCAPLAVGQSCTLSKSSAPGKYSDFSFSVTFTHPSDREWLVTGTLTASATKFPLLEPPVESNTFCGDGSLEAETSCSALNGSGLDVFISIPLQIPGRHMITYECEANGEVKKVIEGRFSYAEMYVGSMPGGPVFECESPKASNNLLSPPGWTLSRTHQGVDDTTNAGAHFGIGAVVTADQAVSYITQNNYAFEHTVHLNLAKMRIIVGP